jgi:hypothetical protein
MVALLRKPAAALSKTPPAEKGTIAAIVPGTFLLRGLRKNEPVPSVSRCVTPAPGSARTAKDSRRVVLHRFRRFSHRFLSVYRRFSTVFHRFYGFLKPRLKIIHKCSIENPTSEKGTIFADHCGSGARPAHFYSAEIAKLGQSPAVLLAFGMIALFAEGDYIGEMNSRRHIRKSMKSFSAWQICALVLMAGWLCVFAASASAAVAVVSNRTETEVKFTLLTPGGTDQHLKAADYKLAAGDLTVLNLHRGETARLIFGGTTYPVQADSAYYFGASSAGKLELAQIGLAGMPDPTADVQAPDTQTAQRSSADFDAARTITVKILVDEEENSKPAVWQHRLKERVAAVSAILDHYCGMRLKVVAAGTWQSDNQIHDFEQAVTEFVQKVDPGEARIAIGFTSQYQIVKGRTHLGGTRGPLARHILLREWSQFVSEPERMELLLHEVGHFLGAVHSPESDSVMRVILGDKQARARKFQVHFDPLNTLAINLVAEEWRQHPLYSFAELSQPTKDRLRSIYFAIDQALPEDPAAKQYMYILDHSRMPRVMIGSQ